MSKVRWTVALGAALASLGTAAVALADTELSGTTAQGVDVKLTVGEFGNATSFTISSYEVECKHGTLNTGKIAFNRFDVSDPGAFRNKTRDQSRSGALKFKSKTSLTGLEDAVNPGNWAGTYKRRTKVFKRKDKLDTCRVQTTWNAS
jgi:hypothetical protein